jgi:hypothetical protein
MLEVIGLWLAIEQGLYPKKRRRFNTLYATVKKGGKEMETREYKVYEFNELSALGKEQAIEKFRENNLDYKWWDCTYEDVKEIGALMGIEISNIYFSGFYSQGDGACFEGCYNHRLGSTKDLIKYAPMNSEVHEMSRALSIIQKPYFYQLSAAVTHSGQYYHENCANISVMGEWEQGEYGYDEAFKDTEIAITEVLRDFMKWIYKALESDYDYLQSDGAIKETLIANEYKFTEDGVID